MRVHSVNVSPVRTVERNGRTVSTAIFKRPTTTGVRIGRLGLAGDDQADKKHHGGPEQAVYALALSEYLYWREELRRDIPIGLMGENLTIDGLDDAAVCIGDVFRIGTAELQVSKTRAPCATLAMAMDDAGFPKRFLAKLRVGPYFRVLREGEVGIGDAVEKIHTDPAGLTCPEATRLMYLAQDEREAWARAAEVATLCPVWRDKFRARARAE
ncbi:MAG: MOSC domain-containing protein [Phycisphaerae bacterium]|nr:MOSC domain-containing protein [Phycisphaerae bacterium]